MKVSYAGVASAALAVCYSTSSFTAEMGDSAEAVGAAAALDNIIVTAKRLDEARNGLSTDTGSSVYAFDKNDLAQLPLGVSTPLNQVILQAPGVVQDSFGELHVRGDHGNLQYRINGVAIPEAIAGFGQALDTRFVSSLDILTGALPAQYGYRTAGVVDIRTKGSSFDNGGAIDLLAGSHMHREIGANASGSVGALSYFASGSFLRNDLGIENPTPEKDALHDATKQAKGFAYASYVLDDDSRLSFMYGIADNRFEIPNVPGQEPVYPLAGVTDVDSATLDANQREKSRFEILSYQSRAFDALDYQLSAFHHYSDVHYRPDPVGDLVFNGVAADILRSDEQIGAQFDASYRAIARHILRFGLFFNHEHFDATNQSSVFSADADGNQISDVPVSIYDATRITGSTGGVYVQDEWQPTDALTINYGARFDRVDTVVKQQQFSPRIGLVYDLTSSTRLHAGYARYFTPPPTELIDTKSIAKFENTTNALPSDANTAVSSERSHYFDIGVAQQLTHEITLGLDAYYRDVKDLQDEGQFGNALIFSAFNYEKGRIGGTELSFTYRGENLSAYANVAYSIAQARNVVSGQFNFDQDELDYINSHWVYIDHDQRWSSSAGVSYRWRDTTASADLLNGSGLRRGFANSESLPSYTQINAALTQGFVIPGAGKFDARFTVTNVFDRVYELRDGTGIGVGAPQFGPRRAYFVGLSKPF